MIFHETPIAGAYVLELERKQDHRGFFARIWCASELAEKGLKAEIVQSNVGFSTRKGTLQGLHFQVAPHTEVKVIRCTRGAIYNVIVDLRPNSPTRAQWFGVELNEENGKILYVPEGCAQGYLTLQDNTEINYHTSRQFAPDSASGVRYNDSAFQIVWPGEIAVISDQDRAWPEYSLRADKLKF